MDVLANLGIDLWSLALYAGNVLLLVLVLVYFLYKPVLKVLDDRSATIKGSIEEAARLRDEFEKALAEAKQEKEEVEAELREELAKLQKFTDQKRKELTAEMEAARAEMMQKAQAQIDAKKEAMMGEFEGELKELMVRIIRHVLENEVPEDVVAKSINSAWNKHRS